MSGWYSLSARFMEMSKMFGKKMEEIDTFRDRQLLEEKEHEITVTMTGDSLESAVGNLFQAMRKQIFAEIGHPIIQMETTAVYFQNVKLKRETERFLFLFMPREKVYFTITARIVVKVKFLNIAKEDF